LSDAEVQLREHLSTGKEIADARLRVFAHMHGPKKMLEMLEKYGDLGPRGVIKEQLGKFGFNIEKEIDSIFRMEKMEGESDLDFRKRQQSRISELSVIAGDILGMTTTGTEGGSGGVMSLIEREARSRNVPVPGLKTSQEARKALNDRAKAVVDPADRTFFESINKLVASAIGEAADRGNIQDALLRALDRGGINLPGGGKITKEDLRAGRVSPEDMEELRKELSSGDARFKLVTMSTLEKERNAARGDAEVGAGDAAPNKIENFSKEVSGFVSNITKASKTLENIVRDLEEINKNTTKIRLEVQQ